MTTLTRPNKPLISDLRKLLGGLNPRTLKSFEQLFEAVPAELNVIIEATDGLQHQFIPISSTDSPYAAANNDFILVDTNSGPVDVIMPPSGRVSVSRDGEPNALTLIGTVNGEVDPEILFDGSCATMAFITEWRYV